jgi:5'-nucleotidase
LQILLSNDDGYQARGLKTLAEALATLAEVIIVAPDRDRSGASNSLTLDAPLRVRRVSDNIYCVNGTPTDCVHVAITGLLDSEPDMVVSGINHGANLGDDVLYSGTVAAAMEGRFLGLPAVAISLALRGGKHFDTAAAFARRLISQLTDHPLPPDTILNVNVPDVPLERLAGVATTRLGFRHRSEPVVKDMDPRGRPVYWVGNAGPSQDAGTGTDFHAVAAGQVSVSPISVDLTDHASLPSIGQWLKDMG